ncbi:MAG: hypothetical protein VW080_04015 [Flavobacteriaceae bacterium]
MIPFLTLRNISWLLLMLSFGLSAQHHYDIDVKLNTELETLAVSQTLQFVNNSKVELDTLYLYDWSNSYKNSQTPLSRRLAEEFNDSFYLSSKNKLGYTSLNKIFIQEKNVQWYRINNQNDLIFIPLNQPLAVGDSLSLEMNYNIKIPDDKFTGIGVDSNGSILLRNWILTAAPLINNKWLLNSNLGLDDNSMNPSSYSITWDYPDEYYLESNLQMKAFQNQPNNRKMVRYYGENISVVDFIFTLENTFKTFNVNKNLSLVTDLLPSEDLGVDWEKAIEKVVDFSYHIIAPSHQKKLLILKKDFNRNPLYGTNQLQISIKLSKKKYFKLSFFSDEFLYEMKFLKAFLSSYLKEKIRVDKRKEHWIANGIQHYVMTRYVDRYYPNEKFLGKLGSWKILGIPFFRSFAASKIGFNESYNFVYELSERSNLQQSDILAKDQLTKFNEKVTSPYHVGVGLNYISQYIGSDNLDKALFSYTDSYGQSDFKQMLINSTDKNIDWFFDSYIQNREAYDFSFKSIKKGKNDLTFRVREKNNRPVPVQIGLVKADQTLKNEWIELKGKDTLIQWPSQNADYLVINSKIDFVEKNKLNNWKSLKSTLGFKPLRFTFYGDTEDVKRNQLFYHPISDFNAYDGLTVGMRLYNTRLKSQPFELDFHPQYTFNENTLVGFFRTRYRFYNHDKNNYLNQVFLTARSNHYNTGLRYTVILPSFSMYFRDSDLRSNKKQLLNFSWYNVLRDRDPNIETNPDYSVLSILHRYSNPGTIDFFSADSNFEISDKFGKIHFSSQYRKLFPSGRKLSLRFFAGTFLWHNTLETQFFDFNLNRPSDYLFRYGYLGRSETTGFYSQQFVAAEGGFKSFFEESSANDFMVTFNASMGIWKWIELYGDLGVLKNRQRDLNLYFDSGIRLNFESDYLEIYLPVFSSNGLEVSQSRYASKIRFVITPNIRAFSSLFTRKWF